MSGDAYGGRKHSWRVRFAKWLLPKGYGVIYEYGWHDRRV